LKRRGQLWEKKKTREQGVAQERGVRHEKEGNMERNYTREQRWRQAKKKGKDGFSGQGKKSGVVSRNGGTTKKKPDAPEGAKKTSHQGDQTMRRDFGGLSANNRWP